MARAKKDDGGAAKKEKKTTSKQAVSIEDYNLILGYLRHQNRPYSLNDIVLNLHNSVGKTAAQRCLEKLIADGEVVEKVYGKQSVFVIQQTTLEAPSSEELEALDNRITALKADLACRKETLKRVNSVMAELESTMTLDQVKAKIVSLKALNNEMLDKIRDFQSGTRKVDPDEKAQVDRDLAARTKLLKSRKTMCMDIVNSICEGISVKPKDFMAEVGLELNSL